MRYYILLFAVLVLASCAGPSKDDARSGATKLSQTMYPEEVHFDTVIQLTAGGDNAEAYWSFDDSSIVFQATNHDWGDDCDQIYFTRTADAERMKTERPRLLSTGKGRTTCSYFLPGDTTIIYASTHLSGDGCPPKPEKRTDGKYVWPVYADFDIFVADLHGNIISQLTNEPGYDAEPTVSPNGDRIVFTSMRSGDLELYTMNIDGSDVKQITSELGYDGGAFFSPDGKKLIFRSSRPRTEKEIADYKGLLAQNLVTPVAMELYICNADGSDIKQLTHLGGANWAPFFNHTGDKVIFSSNHASEKGYPFNLYTINVDGTALERISFDGVFDAFPMFSRSGKYLLFSSNRNNGGGHDTNLFLARWKP